MTPRSFVMKISQQLISFPTDIVSNFFIFLLHVLKSTWRIDATGKLKIDQLLMDQSPTIVVFWHGQMVPLLAVLDQYSASVLSSPGFRGRVVGRIVEAFGNISLQAGCPNTRGSLKKALVCQPGLLALAVDGPLGPYHHVKPGAIILSANCSARIVPIFVEARAAGYLPRWDRMVIPLPFAKVSIRVGQPMRFTRRDLRRADYAIGIVRAALEELEESPGLTVSSGQVTGKIFPNS